MQVPAAQTDAPSVRVSVLWAAIPMALSFFCLILSYELLRSASNTLFNVHVGIERMPLVTTLVPLVLFGMVYAYSRLLSRLGSSRTLQWTHFFCFAVILAGYAGITGSVAGSGSAVFWASLLYVFREVYIVLVIEQYWSFLDSTFDEKSAYRFNGAIAGIASLGSMVAGALGGHYVERLGTASMAVGSACSLVPAALLCALSFRRCGEPKPTPAEAGGRKGQLGVHLFFRESSPRVPARDRRALAGGFGVRDLSFPDPERCRRGPADGVFVPVLFEAERLLVASAVRGRPLLLRLFSPFVLYACIPVAHFGLAFFSLAAPGFHWAAIALIAYKSLDYSLFRIVKEISYIGLSFDARYRAKQVIDVFAYRLSNAAAGGDRAFSIPDEGSGGVLPRFRSSSRREVRSGCRLRLWRQKPRS